MNDHSVKFSELPTILPGVTGTPPMVVGTLLILESKLCTTPQLSETPPVVMLIIRVLSHCQEILNISAVWLTESYSLIEE